MPLKARTTSVVRRPAASSGGKKPSRDAPSRDAGARKRYKSDESRGPSAYKAEWNHFISGVRVKDEGTTFEMGKGRDIAAEAEGSTFSYLFAGAAEKKTKKATVKDKVNATKAAKARASDDESKMKKMVADAKALGLTMDGMNRKQRRNFLRVTQTEADLAAADHARRVKPHELMDDKLAWYQQGPSPLDELSEKLVAKKALKHARQQGLKYNYLTPHPSWLAARRRKRREDDLLPWGIRTVFSDE